MIHLLKGFALFIAFWGLLNMLIGFIRPVFVLWFLDRFNRLKVLRVYGGMALTGAVLYGILHVLTAAS
ncbi:hypothetical protein A3SI_05432 [Nitritalea halalkaliphila LW7]|uniref:Uncharacterized protein n=1 Tax=Nitritalea halalkaliphila LW7 TaxID=1189621 RepID=I5C7T3_9BACT|nr:hypothetical protein [Nitritalea halalkaliphila]EIM77885.1 hypothetical protein A3SI_05432 [Nitritalea halalkaliphila LW7]